MLRLRPSWIEGRAVGLAACLGALAALLPADAGAELPAGAQVHAVVAQASPQGAADKQRARDAYDQALAAAERGDLARAAQLFALADQLAPNVVTLVSALQAAQEADDPTLGMELVARADSRPANTGLSATARQTRQRFQDRAGTVILSCGALASCRARIDGRAVAVEVPQWVTTGRHEILFEAGGQSERQAVDVAARTEQKLTPETLPDTVSTTSAAPPESSSADEADDGSILSPAWFGVSLGVTVALGVASAISAVDTQNLHDEFDQAGEGADDGQASQDRTNALFFTTLGFVAVTTVLGLLAVPWGSDEGDDVAAGAIVTPGGFAGGVSLRF